MRVAVDCLSVGVGRSGAVGVYRNLFHFGPELDPQLELVPYVSSAQKAYYEQFIAPPQASRINFHLCRYPEHNRLWRLWFQHVTIPLDCRRIGADIHFTLNPEPFSPMKGVKEVYKITGLQFYHVSDQMARFESIYQRSLVRRKAARAHLIIANSQYMRQDIINQLAVPEDRVRVIYEAVDHSIFHVEQDTGPHHRKLAENYGVNWPFILDVSDLRPYKNPLALVEAFALLVRRNQLPHHLVFIGNNILGYRSVVDAAVTETGLADRVHIFEYIHHRDLVSFYHGASVLVYPSELETFGTPPLEAMACGIPAIIGTATAMPEISGGGAVMTDPHDAEQLAGEILRMITDSEHRRRWGATGAGMVPEVFVGAERAGDRGPFPGAVVSPLPNAQEDGRTVPPGYLALPNARQPWYLLPADDAGPFEYFVNHLLSSRYSRRRWLIAAMRLSTRLGGSRLWPWIGPSLARRQAKQ